MNRISAGFIYDYIIVKAENLKSRLRASNVAVIPNGVDFEKFFPIEVTKARQMLNLPDDKKIILYPADPQRPEKNFQLTRNASDLLSHLNVELITIYEKPQEALNIYYNASDLLLLTSHYEGSPNVVKEAMACNLM